MSPMRNRSLLKSGKNRNTPAHTSPAREIQLSTPSACVTKKEIGRNTSSSRMALRAKMESAVSAPPSRRATRKPMMRLPGVAARGVISNAVK